MDDLRAFAYRAVVAQHGLVQLESELAQPVTNTASWRPREITKFPGALRQEAARMARLYEVFYCLERSVRELVRKAVQNDLGQIPETIFDTETLKALNGRKEAETRSGVMPRTGDLLDYATLGELKAIIDRNWDSSFKEFLPNREAVSRLLAILNTMRSPVAHSIPVPLSEAARLGVHLGDWFRLTTEFSTAPA